MNPLSLTPRQTLLLLALFTAVLGASGFVLEYGFHVLPCKMCWWQRYAHYGILAVSLLGLAVPPPKARLALYPVALIALVGLGIAIWQFAAQHGWLPFPASCVSDSAQPFAAAEDLLAAMKTTKVVPCDRETFTLLGLSLAGYNIPAMLLTLALSLRALGKR